MAKILLVLIVGLGAAFYFPTSRQILLDVTAPVSTPAYRWVTVKEMERVVRDLEAWDRQDRAFPDPREFDIWVSRRYQTSNTRFDAWGNEYTLSGGGRAFQLRSAGPDGIPGTEDDILITGQRTERRR